MSGNGSQTTKHETGGGISERAFWIAFHRVLLSLAAIIKRYKIMESKDG
jgi:hypothetical protein